MTKIGKLILETKKYDIINGKVTKILSNENMRKENNQEKHISLVDFDYFIQ